MKIGREYSIRLFTLTNEAVYIDLNLTSFDAEHLNTMKKLNLLTTYENDMIT